MKDWRNTLISPGVSILDALKIIDSGSLRIALVVDEGGRLLGTVTDGDIRRALLKEAPLSAPVTSVMNRNPIVARLNSDPEAILAMMRQRDVGQIPVVDDGGRVVGFEVLTDLLGRRSRDNQVVIMAGGLGRRLHPLTENCPKPMLPVGDKPLLELVLEGLISHGFRRFFLAVNYKGEMIKEHFGAGEKWGIDLDYLWEDKRLGTAGPLSLLPEKPERPLLVVNGDILTRTNFGHLLEYHGRQETSAVMCVKDYSFQVPYGVVQVEGDRLVAIREKPVHNFFVNAGMYVLSPEALDFIPKDSFFDMPALFSRLIEAGRKTSIYPVTEFWLDVGRKDDLDQANQEARRLKEAGDD